MNPAAGTDRVYQKTVVSQVMEKIKDLIASGQYKPGDRFPTEQELAARFGTGRSSIREALQIFNHLGVVETRVPKGTFVCERSNISTEAITWAILLGSEDRDETLELRRIIEEQGFRRLVAGFRDGETRCLEAAAQLEAEVDEMEVAAKLGSIGRLLAADFRFHERIIAMSDNRLFSAIFQTLHRFTEEEIHQTYQSVADLLEVVADHREILQAVRTLDPEAALVRHRAHFDRIRVLLAP